MAPSSKKPPPGTNPVEFTFKDHTTPHIASVPFTIAGILITVYGLSALAPSCTTVSCIWLLHPRLQTQECMAPFAAAAINAYNALPAAQAHGLIAVSFDQRNHGTREVTPLSNEAWRGGNETHAQDMFSSYHGTAVDTSQLMDYIGGYIFPEDRVKITRHLVLGISLGGHAAWHCLMQDSRVSAAVIVVGCPDYARLMSDRARLSKRKTWTRDQGRTFMGSTDFPNGLIEALRRYDPAALLWGQLKSDGARDGQEYLHEVTDEDKVALVPAMAKTLGNKRILNLSGGKDKLVPYHASKPWLDWAKTAIGKGGWFEGGGLVLKDVVIEGCGHEVPYEMVPYIVNFIVETVESDGDMTVGKRGRKESRI
jgi:pimeloyl-ACP methyl ester carboxylesterase